MKFKDIFQPKWKHRDWNVRVRWSNPLGQFF